MELKREAGILLHVSSLPGPYGIGDLGSTAEHFIDWLVAAGQRWWQILPLGPPDFTGSPYSAHSSFAGCAELISLDLLVEAGDLLAEELPVRASGRVNTIKLKQVRKIREKLLARAAKRFFASRRSKRSFEKFCETERDWLDDWAVFWVAKRKYKGGTWQEWPEVGLRAHNPSAIAVFQSENVESLETEKYIQFRFYEQWKRLRRYATKQGVKLIGDLPIYCAGDSADVWSARKLFKFDRSGLNPTKVSGVPPDYFSRTGQRWGTPVYDWRQHKAEHFRWWIERVRASLRMVDLLRIDHFRGFESYWEVEASCPTAMDGRWVKGPGDEIFRALQHSLGRIPILAEDLGAITPAVTALRDKWKLPGMKILQFGLEGGASSWDMPHHYPQHCVAYPGTHDNNTVQGWYQAARPEQREYLQRYSGGSGRRCHEDMIRVLYASVAKLVVVPIQDVLGLSGEARMNLPGTVGGNWIWKLAPHQLRSSNARRVMKWCETFDRLPKNK